MVQAYTPILRNGGNERQVIQRFGGFSNFQTPDIPHELELHPIVGVTTPSDLADLGTYEDAGEQVYVDFPVYLGNRSTKFAEEIGSTLENFGTRTDFYKEHSEKIHTPIISGFPGQIAPPIDYSHHQEEQQELQDGFPRIGHRVMLRSRKDGLTHDQEEALRALEEVARPRSDLILFDVVDKEIGEDGPIQSTLCFVTDLFSEFDVGILNAFDAMEGQTENHSPTFARQFSCRFFGDFAIDRRYPSSGGGKPSSVTLPHYHPGHQTVKEANGEDFAQAGEDLIEWNEWDSDHCYYCQDIESMVQQGIGRDYSRWKRARQGHYIQTILRGND